MPYSKEQRAEYKRYQGEKQKNLAKLPKASDEGLAGVGVDLGNLAAQVLVTKAHEDVGSAQRDIERISAALYGLCSGTIFRLSERQHVNGDVIHALSMAYERDSGHIVPEAVKPRGFVATMKRLIGQRP